ncbi:hypothetical protein [Dyadobacter sp. CY356]|uniref:hypothetical protein n=1 Tax=Dyadobacter sp. CY356 TaxID=2906442 RepID=UPI001F430A80|nr:hypothetical protein [Dyadobacter sp. CY356]MCF0055553.1 hypothetical protein [Dyadobacter sp. CY356]
MKTSYLTVNDIVIENLYKAIKEAPRGSEVTIGPKNKTRQQEKYLHAIICEICKHNGADPEDLKDDIKIPILGFTEHDYHGKKYLRPKSSKHISDEQYGKLINAAIVIADFLDVKLRPPSHYGLSF